MTSTTSAPPTTLTIAPGALVCNESHLIGDVQIGSRTVIHPKAIIKAIDGPIIIGENNLIEEKVKIINQRSSEDNNKDGAGTVPIMIIGNNNVFEVDAESYALKIGDSNVLESKSSLGRRIELTDGCVIGAGCKLEARETLEQNTVVYGSNNSRRIQGDKPAPQNLQIDFLCKVLPN